MTVNATMRESSKATSASSMSSASGMPCTCVYRLDTATFDQTSHDGCRSPACFYSSLSHLSVADSSQMEGQEYVYVPLTQPIAQLHVLQKQQRTKTSVRPLSCYYIAKGNAFQAPDLATLIGSRLVSLLESGHILKHAHTSNQPCCPPIAHCNAPFEGGPQHR
jgi:hypothetical protein